MNFETIQAEDYRRQLFCLSIGLVMHFSFLVWNPVFFSGLMRHIPILGNGPSKSGIEVEWGSPAPAGNPIKPLVLPPQITQKPVQVLGGSISHPVLVKSAHPVTPVLVGKKFTGFHGPDLSFRINSEKVAGSEAIPIPLAPHAFPKDSGLNSLPLMNRGAPIDVHHPGSSGVVPAQAYGGELLGVGRTGIHVQGTYLPEPAEPITLKKESSKPVAPTPSIEGQLADRPILHRAIPDYPAWAEEQGIMGSVRLFFTVNQEGKVDSGMRVERTSGNPDLDRLAQEALLQWRFKATSALASHEWGIITFSFSLKSDR